MHIISNGAPIKYRHNGTLQTTVFSLSTFWHVSDSSPRHPSQPKKKCSANLHYWAKLQYWRQVEHLSHKGHRYDQVRQIRPFFREERGEGAANKGGTRFSVGHSRRKCCRILLARQAKDIKPMPRRRSRWKLSSIICSNWIPRSAGMHVSSSKNVCSRVCLCHLNMHWEMQNFGMIDTEAQAATV